MTARAADGSGRPGLGGRDGRRDIYAWLPFTQQDLANAASVAVRFSVDYDTFTYTESAAGLRGKPWAA